MPLRTPLPATSKGWPACWPLPLIVKSEAISTRTARVPLRSSHAAACARLMLVTVTLPAARSFSVDVSVHATPGIAPLGGSRGKKFLNDPTTGDNDCAATLSDAF